MTELRCNNSSLSSALYSWHKLHSIFISARSAWKTLVLFGHIEALARYGPLLPMERGLSACVGKVR